MLFTTDDWVLHPIVVFDTIELKSYFVSADLSAVGHKLLRHMCCMDLLVKVACRLTGDQSAPAAEATSNPETTAAPAVQTAPSRGKAD